MLYDNMNVLEHLMFVLAKLNMDRVLLQEMLFEFLIDIGLGDISLTPVGMLTREQKTAVILTAAAYSDSKLIVFNLPDFSFDGVLVNAIAELSDFIRNNGKTLVLGTQNCCSLIEKACSHTAFIADGRMLYQGTVENLRLNFDKVLVIIRDKNIDRVRDGLASLLPGCRLAVKDGDLLIGNCGRDEMDVKYIYDKISESGLAPDSVEINPKTVQNAYEELIMQHDLQK